MPKIVDHDERREFLASVSAELIAEHGLERATIREIAARTGFSRGVIEHYFDDKDHLITMAVVWVNDRYIRREQQATAGKEGLAALAARLQCVLPLDREAVQEWKIRLRFWSEATYHEDMQKILGGRLRLSRERYCQDLRLALERDEVAAGVDPERAAHRLSHVISGVSVHALIAPAVYNRRYLKEFAAGLIEELRSGHGALPEPTL